MNGVVSRYCALVDDGRIEADPAQSDLARQLAAFADRLDGYRPARPQGALGRWLTGRPSEPPRGLYIHGAVGRGKTFLMDLFYEAVRVAPKRRAHFHAFMADVHARIHAWRQLRKRGEVEG